MPSITDWLMVIITAIYAVLTFFILKDNNKSVKAANKQAAESKRQYEETKRLAIMPYIQFEKTNDSYDHLLTFVLNSGKLLTGEYTLSVRIKNIGNGTAKTITYTYQWDNFTKSHNKGAFPVQALSAGESEVIRIDFAFAPGGKDTVACFILHYEDLLENAYTQQLQIRFKSIDARALKLVELSTSSPEFEPKEATNA